jgi:hypothetical protein
VGSISGWILQDEMSTTPKQAIIINPEIRKSGFWFLVFGFS